MPNFVDVNYDTYEWRRPKEKAAAVKVKTGYKMCSFIQECDKLGNKVIDKGIMPSILQELLKARKDTKKLMANESDPFMKNIYDKRQLAIKVTANSLYGQTGAITSSFFEKDVAASTTAIGRKLLIYGKRVVEGAFNSMNKEHGVILKTKKYGEVRSKAEYIYGDTDSIFFCFNLEELDGTKILGKKALEITIELAQVVGREATRVSLKNPHDLEYEKTFLKFILLSKKRYVGMLYEFDINKGKRKEMGIVLKRRDNAPIVKDIYGGCIDILIKDNNNDDNDDNDKIALTIDFIRDYLKKIVNNEIPIEKLIITKSLRDSYKNPMQIAHNVLAERIGDREPGNKPKPGDRIPYVYIKNSNKNALQGERIENPKYVIDNKLEIDYAFYITNQIMKPIQQLLALRLEEIEEFKMKYSYTSRKWNNEIEKLREKWKEPEKLQKKIEELRMKEIKLLIFDEYIKSSK